MLKSRIQQRSRGYIPGFRLKPVHILDAKRMMQRMSKLGLPIFLLLLGSGAHADSWTPPTRCDRPLSQRLYESAVAAPSADKNGTLYGIERWRGTTGSSQLGLKFPGLLSCAYTVSAIFRGACHPIGELASVKSVDAALTKWRKITNVRDLRPGDVVFWKPVPGTVLGFKCPGHWHVGISLGGEFTMDNDWWSGKPRMASLTRSCTAFSYARRPPE